MKAAVLLLWPIGLASAAPQTLALWDSWFKKASVTTAQAKVTKAAAEEYRASYRFCMKETLQMAKYCNKNDIVELQANIKVRHAPMNF